MDKYFRMNSRASDNSVPTVNGRQQPVIRFFGGNKLQESHVDPDPEFNRAREDSENKQPGWVLSFKCRVCRVYNISDGHI